MFNQIKKLFSKSYSLGALESPTDPRNIDITKIQKPIVMPVSYETSMKRVLDQGSKPKCVGSAIVALAELHINKELSDDDLYEQCKKNDGIPEIAGTYPSVGAKMICKYGVKSIEAYKKGKDDRIENKLQGYAFVPVDYNLIAQAIYQNKAVTASFSVDTNWFIGFISKVLKSIGQHYVVLNGFDYNKMSFIGLNSWGTWWIGYIAGIVNPKIKQGHFECLFEDVKDTIKDIIAFTPIPKDIIENIEKEEYRFLKTFTFNQKGFEVSKLQERLNSEGYPHLKVDGHYGNLTKKNVELYQRHNGLTLSGIADLKTLQHMNKKAKEMITVMAEGIKAKEGFLNKQQMPPAGSRSFRNNNPGNFKVGAKLTPYMKQLGATGVDSGGFAIFPSYKVGMDALCSFLTSMCSGKLRSYKETMTLEQMLNVYAPAFDNNNPNAYANFLAKRMGITVDTIIGLLV